jgi:hypothetical protein
LPQINWDYCIFCRQKAIKKDRKLNRNRWQTVVNFFYLYRLYNKTYDTLFHLKEPSSKN